MGLVDRFERKLESTVGDAFARVFGGSIVPQEVEAMLRREAETGAREIAAGRVLAPNDYVITLSVPDYQKVSADPDLTSATFAKHLEGYIHEQGWQTYGDVVVRFEQSSSLHTGQFRASGAVNPDSTSGDPAPPPRKHSSNAESGVPMSDNPTQCGGQGPGRPADEYYDDRYGRPEDRGPDPRAPYPPQDQGGYPPQREAYPPRQGGYPEQAAATPSRAAATRSRAATPSRAIRRRRMSSARPPGTARHKAVADTPIRVTGPRPADTAPREPSRITARPQVTTTTAARPDGPTRAATAVPKAVPKPGRHIPTRAATQTRAATRTRATADRPTVARSRATWPARLRALRRGRRRLRRTGLRRARGRIRLRPAAGRLRLRPGRLPACRRYRHAATRRRQ